MFVERTSAHRSGKGGHQTAAGHCHVDQTPTVVVDFKIKLQIDSKICVTTIDLVAILLRVWSRCRSGTVAKGIPSFTFNHSIPASENSVRCSASCVQNRRYRLPVYGDQQLPRLEDIVAKAQCSARDHWRISRTTLCRRFRLLLHRKCHRNTCIYCWCSISIDQTKISPAA